jgi:predicted ATPase
MLNHLSIKNFKGWKNTGNIELAPITVFFGSNSSGKSSIGQFLVMLKQTVQQSDRKTVLMLSGDKAPVNLGTPADIFHNHDMKEKIQLEYGWSLDKKSDFGIGKNKRHYDTIKFKADIQVNNPEIQYLEVGQFSYDLFENEKRRLSVGMKKSDEGLGSRNYELFSEVEELKRTKGRAWKLTEPVKFYGFPDAALAYYQDSDFLQDLNLHQENFFSKFYYLGPLRSKSRRIYSWAGTNPDSVGDDGIYTIQAILSAKHEGRKLSFPHTRYKPFEAVIGNALQKMELIENYKINRIENRQDYEVKVKIKGSSEYVSLPDVGFGVSQVLPVIVQLFYAPSGSVIFIEQPEIHLHPKAQTLLADVIIDAINMRENSEERKIQVIIETHSEYLLRRLQMRISDKTVKTEDVRAYFACNQADSSVLEELQVDTYGNILNWPEGFFGDIEKDMYDQAMNAMNRRIQERDAAIS